MPPPSPAIPPNPTAIIRRALAGQLLFSAGHALTTGGFLSYFADPFFKGAALSFSLLLVIPETAESLGILTRWVVDAAGSRKTVWWSGLLLGRAAALAIPLLVYRGMTPDSPFAVPTMLALVVCWYLLQGISFTAYLSWLSDLVPEVHWGRLLSRRSMAISLVTLVVTLVTAATFEAGSPDPEAKLARYTILFSVGGGLCFLSLVPMIGLPEVRRRDEFAAPQVGLLARIGEAFRDPPFLRFLIGCWQLSFFQGLTQSPNFILSAKVLGVSQLHYYAMYSLMLVLQIPLAMLAGKWVDRGHDRKVMVWGVLGLSLAMGCWELATWFGPLYLIPAYVIWGSFGLINVAQISLAFKLAPRSDNTAHIAIYRQLGGMFAAVAGICGGLLMRHYTPKGGLPSMEVFRWLYLVSWIGRATAALWFIGPKPNAPRSPDA